MDKLQLAADHFNDRYKPGDQIRVWRGRLGDGEGEIATIQKPGAHVLGGHTAVVQVERGCVRLSNVRPA